jgi:Zn-dependent protease with chaperone function
MPPWCSTPRLGIFGWQVNYLLVGLPLMQGLSPEQFEGVLAHELGHLRGGHGRFGGWIYRVNATWMQLLEQLGTEGVTGALLRSFFKWYAPFFHAYSFALRRQDEYEADSCAARLVGSSKYADALCLLPAHGHFVETQYWKGVFDKHRHHPEPTDTPLSTCSNGSAGNSFALV